MLQPVKRGRALLAEIEEALCPTPTLWWLGHCGFALKYRRSIIYIDPYLSNDKPRLAEAPFAGGDVTHAGLILATHAHRNHLDPGTAPAMLAASPPGELVLTIAAAER